MSTKPYQFGHGAICVAHAMSEITPFSFHALFMVDHDAASLLREGPPFGRFLAFQIPAGWSLDRMMEVANSIDTDGKLPRGVRKWEPGK